MRKSWALRALSSVAIAAVGVAWAADNGAGSPKTEGTGQPTEKRQGNENGSTQENGAPVTAQPPAGGAANTQSPNGLQLDRKIDRLPAKRSGKDEDSAQQNGAPREDESGATDNGSSDKTAPENPANPPTTLFPANPKPPADPGKPGNPVTPTLLRIA